MYEQIELHFKTKNEYRKLTNKSIEMVLPSEQNHHTKNN
jgi:hypothetical protein